MRWEPWGGVAGGRETHAIQMLGRRVENFELPTPKSNPSLSGKSSNIKRG